LQNLLTTHCHDIIDTLPTQSSPINNFTKQKKVKKSKKNFDYSVYDKGNT